MLPQISGFPDFPQHLPHILDRKARRKYRFRILEQSADIIHAKPLESPFHVHVYSLISL